ncbi:hypothetical protein CHS0354_004268 [Potamilus streckersoni]|uniref:C2H2-type domain-containing protein n=1 Tax=Potamilus streckersoni TaxID=2493646 RepID=A0AAE0S4P7_9BIVA|nr:hypothetical protein CHS0354_004268 [Potamilus streckersoni]
MSDKKPGTNPLLARYKSTVDCFYKGNPDTGKEIQGNSITFKRKGQNLKGDSESSLEKKARLENDGVCVSRESSVDRISVSSTNITKGSVSKECHDGKEGNLENKLIIINKREDSCGSAGTKTFLEENDVGLKNVSQENGIERNMISSVNVKQANEEPENKREKFIKTGDVAGFGDEGIFGEVNGKSSLSGEGSVDEGSCISVDDNTSSIMKISYNENEGKLEMVVEELSSANNKRDSVCSADKEARLRSVSQEGSVINANIMTEKLEKEGEKSTSAGKKESALKRKDSYVKMTTAIEEIMERKSVTKNTCKVFICNVCKVSFSSVEIQNHRKLCPSVVVKRLTVPELVSWLSFSPLKTKVILERLKENDIKLWSSTAHKVHNDVSRSLGQRFAKDSLHKPLSSSRAQKKLYQVVNSLEKEKEQENICASDNKYVCGKCRMTFTEVSNLKLHLLNHLTGPEELKLSSKTEELGDGLAKSNLQKPIPQENLSGPKSQKIAPGVKTQIISPGVKTQIISPPGVKTQIISPPGVKTQIISPGVKTQMISPGVKTQIISPGMKTQIISPGLQNQIISSPPTVMINNSYNPNSHESSPETKKNLASTRVETNMNSPGFRALNILLENKTSVKQQMSDIQTIPASVTQHVATQTTSRLQLQTNAVIQENNVKPPVAINNSWLTQETVGFPRIKQEVSDSLETCNQSLNMKPTWMGNDLQTTNSSRSVDVSLARGTNQVLDHDQPFTNHISHSSDLPPGTVTVTHDVRIQGGSSNNSTLSSDLCWFTNILTRDESDSSSDGSLSKTTGTGYASVVGSPAPNKSSLIVSKSLFNFGKTNSSISKSSSTVQNLATALPAPSPTAKALQALRDKLKNSHQAMVSQLPDKMTGPGQKSLSKMSKKSQQESRRKSRTPSSDFKCSICSTMLRTADELRKHEVVHTLSSKLKDIVSRVKKTEEFVCELCKMLFVKEELLKIHIHSAHQSPNKPVSSSREQAEEFVCGVCKQIFDTDNDLKTHITAVHRIKIEDSEENEVFYCGLCNKSFQTSSELENHMPVHAVDKFVCGICNLPFIQSKHLIEHMSSHAGTSAL